MTAEFKELQPSNWDVWGKMARAQALEGYSADTCVHAKPSLVQIALGWGTTGLVSVTSQQQEHD